MNKSKIEKHQAGTGADSSTNADVSTSCPNNAKPLVSSRFFTIYGKKRESHNEFTRFGDAVENFKIEFFKALKIPQIVEWLNKRLK